MEMLDRYLLEVIIDILYNKTQFLMFKETNDCF